MEVPPSHGLPPGSSRRAPRARPTRPEGGHETTEVKIGLWAAPFLVLTSPSVKSGRSWTKVCSIDPKRLALSPARTPLLFSLAASQTFQPNTPPLFSAPLAPTRRQVCLGLARARAVEWRRRASDPPTSWGASGRDTGGAASGRRKTSGFGLRNCDIEKAADEPKKHVGMIDDGHADPMLRRYIFAPARAPRADITYTLARSGGEVLLSVMGL